MRDLVSQTRRWIGRVTVLVVLTVAGHELNAATAPIGSGVTIRDIVAGVYARHSQIQECDIAYTITDESFQALRSLPAPISGRPSSAAPALPPPIAVESAHLIVAGNRRAFEEYSGSGASRTLRYKGIFDGETLRVLDATSKTGAISRSNVQDVIRFRTVPKLLQLESVALEAYIANQPNVEASVAGVKDEGAEPVVTILTRRVFVPIPSRPQFSVITKFRIEVLPEKNFWIRKITRIREYCDAQTGENVVQLLSMTKVDQFEEVGPKLYYPRRIVTENYIEQEAKNFAPGHIPPVGPPQLASRTTLLVKHIAVNDAASSQLTFRMPFPKGTAYYDDIAGVSGVTGEPVDELSRRMRELGTGLNASKYTKEQAMALLKQRNRDRSSVDPLSLMDSNGRPAVTRRAESGQPWWQSLQVQVLEIGIGVCVLGYAGVRLVRRQQRKGA